MQGKRFIQTLRLQNLLSYGSEGKAIALEPLNVLIGPNASGKSNLIEAIGLLRAMPKDIAAAVREGGGIGEWLWKGGRENPVAEIEAVVDYPEGQGPLRYQIGFTMVGQRLEITGESVADERPAENETEAHFFYRYHGGDSAEFNSRDYASQAGAVAQRSHSTLTRKKFNVEQSILAQVKDPQQYRELSYLGDQFSNIRLYRNWNMGHKAEPRRPQPADLPTDFLEEDASNLGLVLNDLQYHGIKPLVIDQLKKFYGLVDDITVRVYGNTVQVFLHEQGLGQPIPATRLSDGTLRYLCLLAVLCHPSPPPLICIEEPELGLHPDILPTIAELLIEASRRTQLIVTTHSADLVSALAPESVLVCERDESQASHLRRLEPELLEEWLKDFSLGSLWRMGEIGGTRW